MKKKLLVLLLAFVFLIPSVRADEKQEVSRKDFLNNINDEVDFILENYYGDINEENLREGILKGMHDAVDPWTESYSTDEYDSFVESLNGDYVGLGVSIRKVEDYLLIAAVIEDSAADQYGLQEGDRIYEVEGQSVKDMELKDATELMKGQEGTRLNFKLKRKDTSNFVNVSIIRKPFVVKTVKHYQQDGVDVIKIIQFGENTYNEIKEVLDSKGIKAGFIIDLRDNPGGYFEVCNKIADKLLEENSIITIVEQKTGKQFLVTNTDNIKNNIVVLINKNSASASELLSAALKENNRALIIGETSFGKGLIQQIYLYNNRYIKVTTGEFKSPKGKTINEVGVVPDIVVNREAVLFDLHSKFKPMLSYTEFNVGDANDEIIGIKQRFNYLGKNLTLNNKYDDTLLQLVNGMKEAHSLEKDGKIDLKFKKLLEDEIKIKVDMIVRDKQLKRAIEELKKMK